MCLVERPFSFHTPSLLSLPTYPFLYTLRGTGTKGILVCEEMAHMDPEVLYKTVLPTLARKGVVLIGITTLDDPSTSFWGQMMLAKYPDGRPVFRVLRYSLVCDVCRLAGVETTCKHKLGDLP